MRYGIGVRISLGRLERVPPRGWGISIFGEAEGNHGVKNWRQTYWKRKASAARSPQGYATKWTGPGTVADFRPHIEACSNASGTDVSPMAVAPGTIVEDFDGIEEICPRQSARLIDAFADSLLLQAATQRPLIVRQIGQGCRL